MSSKTWRGAATNTLSRVFNELPPEATIEDAKKAIFEAYPFGPRENHPYRIWCNESKRWLEQRFPEIRRERDRVKLKTEMEKRGGALVEANPGLFD